MIQEYKTNIKWMAKSQENDGTKLSGEPEHTKKPIFMPDARQIEKPGPDTRTRLIMGHSLIPSPQRSPASAC
jgi:hypothetical protein